MRSKLFLLFSTRHALLTDLKAQKRGQVSLRAKAPDDDEYDFAEDDDDDPSNFSVGQFVDEDADSFLETKAKTKSITLDEDQHYFNTVRGEDDVQDTYDSANDLKYDDSFVQMALKNHIELNKKNKGMPATFFQERHIQESVAPDDGEFDFAEDDGDDPSNFNVGQFLGDDEDGDGEESFAQIKKPSEENEYTDDSSKVEYVSAQEAKREKGKSKQESPEEDEDDDEDDADEEDDDEDDEDGDDDDDEEVEDDDDEDEEGEDDDDGDDAFLQNKGVHKRRHHHSHDRSQKHRHHHRQLHHNKHAPLVNNSPSSPREKAAPAKEQTIKLTTEIEKTESTPPAKMLRGTAEKAPAEKPKKRKERTHKKKGSLLGVTDVYEQLAQEEREMKIRGNDDSEWEALDAEDNEGDDEMEESFLQTSDGDDDDYADDRLDGGMEMMGTLENRTENEEDDEN